MIGAKKVTKVKVLVTLLVVGIVLISGCVRESGVKDDTEADGLAREAKQAFDSKDYDTANEIMDDALKALDEAEKIPSPEVPEVGEGEGEAGLSTIKVASQYRRVTDGIGIGRSVGDVIEILKETQTEFIFQGWMRQLPCPETCSDLPQSEQEMCKSTGYSYEYLTDATSQIKKEMPDVIFGGGILAEFLNAECWNPVTGKTFERDETWEMALDPSKWGISMSKTEAQTEWAISRGWTKKGQSYNPKEQMHYYFPDLTNPDFKELFLSYATKQIDCGVDAIWIDMLYVQPELLKRMTGDINHLAVKESYEAASDIVDEIHKYGHSKGRCIYVISWAQPIIFKAPYPQPDLDAYMVSVSTKELRAIKMDVKKWELVENQRNEIENNDVPILVRIDYGNVGSPLSIFSQELTKSQSRQFLKTADEFFQQKGMVLIYPIHGGNMGGLDGRGETLSYGEYDWYDSLAPEFQTYETIKELAQKKSD